MVSLFTRVIKIEYGKYLYTLFCPANNRLNTFVHVMTSIQRSIIMLCNGKREVLLCHPSADDICALASGTRRRVHVYMSAAMRVTYILASTDGIRALSTARVAVTGNGRNNRATSLNCRTISPSARRKWNGMEYGAYIASRNRYAVLHTPSARGVHTRSRSTLARPSGYARAWARGRSWTGENSAKPNYRTHGEIARMSEFKLSLVRVAHSLSVPQIPPNGRGTMKRTMSVTLESTSNDNATLLRDQRRPEDLPPARPRASPRLSHPLSIVDASINYASVSHWDTSLSLLRRCAFNFSWEALVTSARSRIKVVEIMLALESMAFQPALKKQL